jgi:membrane fusion protein, multidrug efflux system
MRRKTIIALVAIIAVLAAAAGLAHRYNIASATTERPAAAPPPSIPVVAATVERGDVPIYFYGVGTVIAYNTVAVRSQIQGQITQINFKEGQAVRAGDQLALIDPAPYQAQVDQMVAARGRDQAQLTNAQANLDRYTKLVDKGWATQQLADTQKAQVAQLQNAVKGDEALIQAANVQLEYTKLTSPIDGVTGIRQVDIGNIIHSTDPNGLVVVTQIAPISVIFTLPETDLPNVQQQMLKGALTVLAYSQDNSTKLDEGTLGLVDNEILQTTGTIRLKADFPNKDHLLWPGELINVRLLFKTEHDGLTIAASAVQQGPHGPYVYVVAADGTAQMHPVVVSQLGENKVLVNSGLNGGETVVTDGQYRLQPGSRVQILHGAAAQQADLQSAVEQAIP